MGVKLQAAIIYENNKEVLYMIKSDGPFGLKTRHLNIKLFFTKQFTDDNSNVVRYFQMDGMAADLLSKPLVGQKFSANHCDC